MGRAGGLDQIWHLFAPVCSVPMRLLQVLSELTALFGQVEATQRPHLDPLEAPALVGELAELSNDLVATGNIPSLGSSQLRG